MAAVLKLACSKHPRFNPATHLDEGAKITCAECRAVLDIYEIYVLHLSKYETKPKTKKKVS